MSTKIKVRYVPQNRYGASSIKFENAKTLSARVKLHIFKQFSREKTQTFKQEEGLPRFASPQIHRHRANTPLHVRHWRRPFYNVLIKPALQKFRPW